MKNKSSSIFTHPPPFPPLPPTADLGIGTKTAITFTSQPECYTALKGEIHTALNFKLGRVMVAFF